MGSCAVAKIVTFNFSKENFYRIVDQLKKLTASEEETKIIKRVKIIDRVTTKVFLIAGVMTFARFCIVPIIFNFKNFILVIGENSQEIPIKCSFPFNVSLSPAYEILLSR